MEVNKLELSKKPNEEFEVDVKILEHYRQLSKQLDDFNQKIKTRKS